MYLIEELKMLLEDHLSKNPGLSINGFAKTSKVSSITLNKIFNHSIKGIPSPHTVLNIMSAIYAEKNLRILILKTDGDVKRYLINAFKLFDEKNSSHQFIKDLNEVLEDRVNYFIYKLAANRTGTSDFEIGELFGKLGEKHLDVLLKEGILYREETRIHAKDKDFALDITVAHKHLSMLVKFYKPDQVRFDKNIFYSLSESLNDEGVQKIKKIHKEAVKKIYDVMNCPSYEGDIPYFSISLADTVSLKPTMEVIQ